MENKKILTIKKTEENKELFDIALEFSLESAKLIAAAKKSGELREQFWEKIRLEIGDSEYGRDLQWLEKEFTPDSDLLTFESTESDSEFISILKKLFD